MPEISLIIGMVNDHVIVTFRMSRRPGEMYCGHAHVSVRSRMPTLLHGGGGNLGVVWGCPLVVHYWEDLQSVHGLCCYGNTMEMRGRAQR